MKDYRTPEGKAASIAALDAHREATQFASDRQPAIAGHSIQRALKKFIGKSPDRTDPKFAEKLLGPNATLGEIAALNVILKATQGDMRAMEYLTDRIDGKVDSVKYHVGVDTSKMTEEEIDARITQLQKLLASDATPGDQGGAGSADGEEEQPQDGIRGAAQIEGEFSQLDLPPA